MTRHRFDMPWRVGLAACGVLMTLAPGTGSATILPPNNLDLEDRHSATSMRQEEFDEVLDTIEFYFRPQFYFLGGRLVLRRFWDDSTVNAFAHQSGADWYVDMYGGLARRPEITLDGFTLVACHEVGHHLGGYPFYADDDWAAAEGAADYFAAQSCARWIWRADTAINASFRRTAPASVRTRCDAAWSARADRDLCYRLGVAAKSVADLFAALESSTVDFDTPDTRVVSATTVSHPAAQCRLDTYLEASLCTVAFDYDKIPGSKTPVGRNSALAELEAAAGSCAPATAWLGVPGYNGHDRPACWFRTQLTGASGFLP